MLVGHVAAAMVAKKLQPRLSLGTAVVASIVADVLLFSFVLAGVERVQFRSSAVPGEYFTGADIALSHSLAMCAVWGAAIATAHALRHRDPGAAAALVALGISHFLLDVVSHRPSMPVAPWIGIVPFMVIEGVIWAGAIVLYVRDSRSTTSAGRYVFWGGVAALTYVWYFNAFLPPRLTPQEAPIEALILLLLTIAWAYWMNRAREMKGRRT